MIKKTHFFSIPLVCLLVSCGGTNSEEGDKQTTEKNNDNKFQLEITFPTHVSNSNGYTNSLTVSGTVKNTKGDPIDQNSVKSILVDNREVDLSKIESGQWSIELDQLQTFGTDNTINVKATYANDEVDTEQIQFSQKLLGNYPNPKSIIIDEESELIYFVKLDTIYSVHIETNEISVVSEKSKEGINYINFWSQAFLEKKNNTALYYGLNNTIISVDLISGKRTSIDDFTLPPPRLNGHSVYSSDLNRIYYSIPWESDRIYFTDLTTGLTSHKVIDLGIDSQGYSIDLISVDNTENRVLILTKGLKPKILWLNLESLEVSSANCNSIDLENAIHAHYISTTQELRVFRRNELDIYNKSCAKSVHILPDSFSSNRSHSLPMGSYIINHNGQFWHPNSGNIITPFTLGTLGLRTTPPSSTIHDYIGEPSYDKRSNDLYVLDDGGNLHSISLSTGIREETNLGFYDETGSKLSNLVPEIDPNNPPIISSSIFSKDQKKLNLILSSKEESSSTFFNLNLDFSNSQIGTTSSSVSYPDAGFSLHESAYAYSEESNILYILGNEDGSTHKSILTVDFHNKTARIVSSNSQGDGNALLPINEPSTIDSLLAYHNEKDVLFILTLESNTSSMNKSLHAIEVDVKTGNRLSIEMNASISTVDEACILDNLKFNSASNQYYFSICNSAYSYNPTSSVLTKLKYGTISNSYIDSANNRLFSVQNDRVLLIDTQTGDSVIVAD